MNILDFARKIYPLFITKRIEIRNLGNRFNSVLILGENFCSRPESLQTADGECVVIENTFSQEDIRIQTIGKGKLIISLMAVCKEYNKEILPFSIGYAHVIVNGKEYVTNRAVTYEHPLRIESQCEDSSILDIHIETAPVQISPDVLYQNLSKLYREQFKSDISNNDYSKLVELISSHVKTSILSLNNFLKANELFKILIHNYQTNVWPLKRQIILNKKLIHKNIYVKAYYDILHSYASWIGLTSSFQTPPVFPHKYHGIFISEGAKFGSNCTIFQNVTIGSNKIKSSKHFGFPVIGNNVTIGAGASIIGKIHIGNNVRIGAGCSVAEDVSDNETVVSTNPRHILRLHNKISNTIQF